MDIKALIQQRADFYRKIREYFQQQNVLEVEVPVIGRSGPTDLHLASMNVFSGGARHYLQTSPEFFMKRLLAQGSGDIFSIGKAFREGEAGSRHNPEFSMLEWYRLGYDLPGIMADVQSLVRCFLPDREFETRAYAKVFESHLGLNPHSASDSELAELVSKKTDFRGELGRASCLDLLMSTCIEPALRGQASFLFDFPSCQAAMAQIGPDHLGQQVARRFELYIDGVEIANGYLELADATEQRRRFEADNIARESIDLEKLPIDETFLQALSQMPDCSGVALGLDRLLWLLCRDKGLIDDSGVNLEQVLLFPWQQL
ncbi:MAG: EF-P lysine aminoacylase EpmA [Pseudomonadales bacterium]